MANLQVKDVPEALHRKIRRYAERRGRTIRDVVLDAVTRESAGLHESIKALEQRQWEQRSRTTRPEERP